MAVAPRVVASICMVALVMGHGVVRGRIVTYAVAARIMAEGIVACIPMIQGAQKIHNCHAKAKDGEGDIERMQCFHTGYPPV